MTGIKTSKISGNHHLFFGMGIRICLVLLLSVLPMMVWAQQYDYVIKGGHVIDPKNDIDGLMDIAVMDGKVSRVNENIPAENASRVIDATGLYVTPGLIDTHVHVFHQEVARAIKPDVFSFRAGVTTVVDAGTTGWRNFPLFKEQTIDKSRTRVLAFLSIVGVGSAYKTQSRITTQNVSDMDPVLTAYRIREYPDILVGIKAQHYEGPDYTNVERAVEAGEMTNVPVMVDFGGHIPPLSLETLLLEKLRPGDIYTHTFYGSRSREGLINTEGRVKPFIFEAQRSGIQFNVGHGGGGFQWEQAKPAMEQGFFPDVIDTDTHTSSINGGMKDMANLMSKFLAAGLSIQEVVRRTTWNPARQIKREDLGHLSEGSEADIAVFNLREGNFKFLDARGIAVPGSQKLEAELTLRAGRVVWDLNGLAAPEWSD